MKHTKEIQAKGDALIKSFIQHASTYNAMWEEEGMKEFHAICISIKDTKNTIKALERIKTYPIKLNTLFWEYLINDLKEQNQILDYLKSKL